MLNNYLNRPRNKAWLGAAIGAAVALGSTIFGAITSKNAQAKQYALQRNMEARNAGITGAGNLTQAYANSDELDKEFRNRFLRYGGRRKAEGGGGYKWSSSDTDALISGLGSAGNNFATAIIGQAHQQGMYPTAFKPVVDDRKDNEAVYDSAARSNFLNNYYRTSSLRAGGTRKLKY